MTIKWRVEYTDTFAGQANYSWCERYEFFIDRKAGRQRIVQAAKALAGLSGVRCRSYESGDGYTLYPHNTCTVLFIFPEY